MQSLFHKDIDRTTADSFATFFGNRIPMLFSTKQPQVSLQKNVASELETTAEHHSRGQLSESQYQEQDSSSTLSTGQSHDEAAASARVNVYGQNVPFHPGSLPCGSVDYLSSQVQMERNQSLDWISYPLAGPCFGRIAAAYEPNAIVYPQMMGIAPARVVLPLDCKQGIPVYVNAKQYNAILRRRQTRAKLEAQNKVAKSRKPYLHESRHHHALRRARGSGGRFLNTKNMQQSKPTTQTYGKNLVQQISKEPEIQHSESNSWGASATSGSDVSCIFNNDDIFQQPDLRVTNSSFTMGATTQVGTRSRVMASDDMLLLSIDRCARISTAM